VTFPNPTSEMTTQVRRTYNPVNGDAPAIHCARDFQPGFNRGFRRVLES
jgi:hypothetical protein